MSHRAVSAFWQALVRDLAAADTQKAMEGVRKLVVLQPPSATVKKLIKEHKVGLLVAQAFSTSAQQQGPLSYATYAAASALQIFLLHAGNSVGLARKAPHSGPFHNPAAGSLAAELSRQLQQSGVLQQLPAALAAIAQQLEACAADPAAPAAAWDAARLSFCAEGHAKLLLQIFFQLMPLCDAEHARQLLAAAAPSAARTCLLLLRAVSAAMQLYDPGSPTAEQCLCFLGMYAGAVQRCGECLITSLHLVTDNDPSLVEQPWVQDTHVYQFNVALAAAAALRIQHDCSSSTASTDSSSSSSTAASSSSRAARASSSSSSAGTGGLAQQLFAETAEKAIVVTNGAWQRSCEVVSSLGTGPQLLLFEQLGLDPRVALWIISSYPSDVCIDQAVESSLVHERLFKTRASSARQRWLQCEQQEVQQQQQEQQQHEGRQQQQQQPGQQQQQQPGQPQQDGRQDEGRQQQLSDWPLEFCLNLLLAAVKMPGRLLPHQMFALIEGWTPFSLHISILQPLASLADNTHAAAAAAAAAAPPNMAMQRVPLQACLKELLDNLLLLSGNLAALARQQQQGLLQPGAAAGSGASSSSSVGSGSGSGSSAGGVHSDRHAADLAHEVTAGTMLVAFILLYTLNACIEDLGPAAAFVVAQASEQGGQQQQQQQQQSFVELVRPRLADICEHYDSCARMMTAIKASTAGPGARPFSCLQLGLQACSFFMCDAAHAVLLASKSGFDSREQRQLFSVQASLLKLSASMKNSSGSNGSTDCEEELLNARICTAGVANFAAAVLRKGMEGDPHATAAAAADAAAAGPPDQQQQPASTATELLPSLAILGRVCLQWAQELQEQAIDVQQGHQRAGQGVLQLGMGCAARVWCSGVDALFHVTGGQQSDLPGTIDLILLLKVFQEWLGKQHVSAQLAAAGYQPQELLQQLELLRRAPAAAAAAAPAGQQPMTQVLQPLVEQLQAVGTALCSLAVPVFCNNPTCSNVSGPAEALLVSGRSCMCAGCRTARYCSRACIRQHWKAHKPVCQALAAAAAAEAAPVG